MNPELILKHFDSISDGPDAIPRLRRFVLDLAIRGKLVEHEQGDEAAAVLLKRIRLKKAEIATNGTLRKEKPLPARAEDELPFSIPANWCWSQLAEIGFINPRNVATDEIQSSFVPMPLISSEYGVAHSHEIRPWAEIRSGFTHFAEGDVALAKITPCFENGKSTIFRGLTGGIGAGTTELHVVRPVIVSADYILIFLKCPHFIESGIPRMTGTAGQKRVPTEYFAYSPFPLPPLAEQHRIVTKVREVMKFCDQLQIRRDEREKRRNRLTVAVAHHLTNGATPEALREHARFCVNNMPDLTARPEQIPLLRQVLLSLAVRGRLVPQESADAAVTESLKLNDHARAVTAKGDHRADCDSQALLAAEERWEVPKSWEWRGLADLALFIDYRGKTPTKVESGIRLITAKNVRRGIINFFPEEFLAESEYDKWMTRGLPQEGDVLFTTEAPMGNAAVVRLEEKFALAQRVICFRLYGALDPDFLVLQILSDPFQTILEKTATGLTAKGIKAAKLKRLPIAIPPPAEQKRIVARVCELMNLCDSLEARLGDSQVEKSRLLESVLYHALADAPAPAALTTPASSRVHSGLKPVAAGTRAD